MKSSLKTFLKGKNPFNGSLSLKGSQCLSEVTQEDTGAWVNYYFADDCYWYLDVLADGTAIAYCPDK